jgi:membrane-anchored glycerophosphoryl diester phosphodiesterase (GDPDase)
MVKMTSVWEATTDFLRDHGGAVLAIAGGLVFVPSVLSNLVEAGTAANAAGPAMLVRGLAGVALTIVSLCGGAAITALAIRPSTPGVAIGHAARRLPALIGVTLLLLIAVTVLILPVFAILAAGGVAITALAAPTPTLPALGGGIALALFTYGFALIAVFLWISARLAVLLPVILAERRGVGAIGRAWTLTRGHGWRLVGLYLLYGLVALVLSGAVGAVAGLIGVLLSGAATGLTAGAVLVALAAATVAALLSIVQSAFVGRLYAALAPTEELRETFA